MLMLLSVHMTSVLFLVRFNNFTLTMGFYWRYTLLLQLPFLFALVHDKDRQPVHYSSIKLQAIAAVLLSGLASRKNLYTQAPGELCGYPGKMDLATPHLIRNYGKHILSLHSMLYVRLCMHKHTYAIQGVFASIFRDMSMHDLNNPGNARACRHLCLYILISRPVR